MMFPREFTTEVVLFTRYHPPQLFANERRAGALAGTRSRGASEACTKLEPSQKLSLECRRRLP